MTPPHPVLIVDENDRFRASLAEQLAFGGAFTTTGAASIPAAEALIRADGARFAAILLDLGLPDGSAREFCGKLRRSGLRLPIILLVGAAREAEVLPCLDAGANDAISKPFRVQDLIGKLRAQIARIADGQDGVRIIGPYEFRPAAKLLQETRRGRKIRLTEKETAILAFLLDNGGEPVSRETLLREVWGYNPKVTTHTLETHIYRLRQKIEPNPAEAGLLLTDARGYRLAAG
ncbi:MAG: response regulator transcription factor [Roseomonas sp.]|nr:response regulator transcription factor [Roseomonas sp.]